MYISPEKWSRKGWNESTCHAPTLFLLATQPSRLGNLVTTKAILSLAFRCVDVLANVFTRFSGFLTTYLLSLWAFIYSMLLGVPRTVGKAAENGVNFSSADGQWGPAWCYWGWYWDEVDPLDAPGHWISQTKSGLWTRLGWACCTYTS